MKTPRDVESIIPLLRDYVHLEDILNTNDVKISGIAILVGHIPEDVSLRFRRSFEKTGKIIFFKDIPMRELSELSIYAYILATKVDDKYVDEVYDGSKVGVLYFESISSPRLRKAFKPWSLYRGEICRGRRCYNFNWLVYVPTYKSHVYLFLCDEEDLQRYDADRDRIIYPLQDLIFMYTLKKQNVCVTSLSLPVFRYDKLPEIVLL